MLPACLSVYGLRTNRAAVAPVGVGAPHGGNAGAAIDIVVLPVPIVHVLGDLLPPIKGGSVTISFPADLYSHPPGFHRIVIRFGKLLGRLDFFAPTQAFGGRHGRRNLHVFVSAVFVAVASISMDVAITANLVRLSLSSNWFYLA